MKKIPGSWGWLLTAGGMAVERKVLPTCKQQEDLI
jgi:hypothetical protein